MTNKIITINQDPIEIFDENSENEIMILGEKKKVDQIAIFTTNGMNKVLDLIGQKALAKMESNNSDITTLKGQTEIKSIASTIAKCKSPLEAVATSLKEKHYNIIKGINGERDRAFSILDKLRDEIRDPVNQMEKKQAEEKKAIDDRLGAMENLRQSINGIIIESGEYQKLIGFVKEYLVFEWGDFAFKAKTLADDLISDFEKREVFAKKSEEDQAELTKHRAAAAEREKKDRDDAIAQKARDEAKKEAEELAEKEKKEAAEREAKIEAEKELALKAAIDAKQRAIEAERIADEKAIISERKIQMINIGLFQDLLSGDFIFKRSVTGASQARISISPSTFMQKMDAETWDKIIESTAKNVIREKEILKVLLEDQAKEKARIAAEAAVEAERKRVEAQRLADETKAALIAADEKHRQKINNEIVSAMSEAIDDLDHEGDATLIADVIIEAISSGAIPNVTINY